MVGSQLCDQPTDNVVRLRLLPSPVKSAKRTIVILSLALAGCRGPVVSNQTPQVTTIRLLTDSSTRAMLIDLAAAYRPANMLMAWNIQPGDGRAVIDWLNSGDAPYALVNYVPDFFAGKNLWTTPAGQNGIAIVVHPSNPVINLSAAQLRSVLQGRIINWQELGGSNTPVTVVAQPDSSSVTALVQSIVLGERRITRAARLATTSEAVVRIVASDPSAIGYVSMGYLTSAVKALSLDGIALTLATIADGTYPITAPILFVGLNEPADDVYRAFFAWVQSPEGQAIVQQRYAPIKK